MLLVILLLLFIIFLLITFIPFQHMAVNIKTVKAMLNFPGPQYIPIIGQALELSRLTETSILDFWTKMHAKFGEIVGFWILGVPILYVKGPDDLEVILGNTHNIKKGVEYLSVTPWLQEGLLLSSGEKWHQRRKLLTPAFHFKILEDGLQSLNNHSKQFLANLMKHNGKPISIDQLVTHCTLDVICETAMGFSLNLQQDKKEQPYLKAVRSVCGITLRRILHFWCKTDWVFRVFGEGRQYYKDLYYLHNFTEKIIQERKAAFKEEKLKKKLENDDENHSKKAKKKRALLDILIEMDQHDGNLFSDTDIREEVDTFMFEGHDTTHSAIVFSLYLLGRHLHVQDKVYEELYGIFGDSDREATIKDLNDMHYLEMVIKESLRLYPPVPYISRTITEDVKLKHYVIPAGTLVGIVIYNIHRNPKYFPDPEVFDPERFTYENCKSRHPYAYIPFSAGPRNCIGQKFAMMELKIVLSTIIRSAKIYCTKEIDNSKLTPILVLKFKDPIELIVKPRMTDKRKAYY